ncbi:DUF4328 domain-containing protein [Flavobacterium sp. ASW18X]|uniref:DUF4328 domain-containing protein n=1 Tax=Flavobacterium sp. ASW18X TaxID=2572595 RepID=UPI0010ADCED8|nr:DUF4328 domain-containing protein [Flavobacterium sp. ASW18X]TKD67240.1 DUF4328 domain-containing protein [Flavobacterium sp. ASW18X]
MTRQQHLAFCKSCNHRYLDYDAGILCSLTKAKANFDTSCVDYVKDESITKPVAEAQAIRPNKKRSQWVVGFLWALLVVEITSIISSYFNIRILEDLQNGVEVDEMFATFNDLREAAIGLLNFIIYIVIIVLFIRWFRRAYYNLGLSGYTLHDEGWASGAWFVPFLNLYRPVQIMNEIDTKLSSYINAFSPVQRSTTNYTLIVVWWFLWIVGGIIDRMVFKKTMNAETIEQLIQSANLQIMSLIIGIPLTLSIIFLIKRINEKEETLLQLEREATAGSFESSDTTAL